MIFVEYGERYQDTMLLLHGGGLSWWNYKDVIDLLKGEFHLIMPVLNGHGGSDREFTSIRDNAEEIIAFIDENYQGKVLLIGGLSLGGQILLEMMTLKKDICSYAVVESALVIPMKMTYRLIRPVYKMSYGLIKKKWFSRLQFQALNLKDELFDYYYRDTCKISKGSMIALLEANAGYAVKHSLKENEAKTLVLVGGGERGIMIQSAKQIHAALGRSVLEVLDHYVHGDISINYAELYVEKIKRLMDGC